MLAFDIAMLKATPILNTHVTRIDAASIVLAT
jgi:hypothetical protein